MYKNKAGVIMDNRKTVLDVLQKIQDKYEYLKNVAENATDQELENILDNQFYEFGTNIQVNFDFMEMIVTRMNHNADLDNSNKSKMSNEELGKYFEKNWDLLSFS